MSFYNPCFLEYLKDSSTTEPLPVAIPSDLLEPVLNYCTMFRDAPKYDVEPSPDVPLTDIDKEFVSKLDQARLGEFINAGNYLNIPRFYDACLLFLREELKTKCFGGVEGVPNFTPEESQKLFEE